jgi:hypothetical protein
MGDPMNYPEELIPQDLKIHLDMLIEANLQFRNNVHDYFYITEEDLALYMGFEEIVELQGELIKLSTMRPVKIYNPETKTFR